MNFRRNIAIILVFILLGSSCSQNSDNSEAMQIQDKITAKDILGDSSYLAISFGGYRQKSREMQPTLPELKEDLLILSRMGVKLLRTYNVQLPHASNVIKAIQEIRKEQPDFEMYMMLGAWIDCKNAWTEFPPDHNIESEQNEAEIKRAVTLAKANPDVVKIIAVGNEAMVKWAESYYVQPDVILKWVNHLQELKAEGELPADLWITSSDDFSSWGGGGPEYHVEALNELIGAVDFISMHTYPMHNTHYNPYFWGTLATEDTLSKEQKIRKAMERSLAFSKEQYNRVKAYMEAQGHSKPIHIGETGWATISNGHYGPNGSRATDEYKEALYYKLMREWSNRNKISCFYFEAFDEPWKDAHNPKGSENHFGLFTTDGKAKFVLWDEVDQGLFEGLTRGGNPIRKTFNGDKKKMMETVKLPPIKEELAVTQ